jgi:hypothetical protein
MKRVTLTNAEISLPKKNFLKIVLKNDVSLKKTDLLEIQKAKNTLLGENSHILLLVEGNTTFNNTEVDEYWASKDSFKNRKAKAIVINSLAQRLNWGVFLAKNKIPTPVKIFSSEQEALTWLEGFSE